MEDGDSVNAAASGGAASGSGAGFLGMPLPGTSSGFLVAPPAQLQPEKPPPAPNDAPP